VARKAARPRAPLAPTSERISEIQSALASQGAFKGDPTGRWDAATIDAMKQFQSAEGLNPSGKLDARTLEKLGLGSDTAGRGAPLPAVAPPVSTPQGSAPQVSAIPSPVVPVVPVVNDGSDSAHTETPISPAQN
jgi:peptidoglycan hydrolase-like protein with peptidoglycan-binding domain